MELSVKTKQRAEEILKQKIYNAIIRETTGRCECGETPALAGYDHLEKHCMARVTICDACGDDDREWSDVLEVMGMNE